MNTPYVKQYDENGVVTNPIVGSYLTDFPGQNRRARRSHKNEPRFMGNGKGWPLTVLNTSKYLRHIQWIFDKATSKYKRIEHYSLMK